MNSRNGRQQPSTEAADVDSKYGCLWVYGAPYWPRIVLLTDVNAELSFQVNSDSILSASGS